MVVINGKQEEATGLTVMDYLTKTGFNPLRVVVEINYEIIPKEKLSEHILNDGDVVEILNFVGGG